MIVYFCFLCLGHLGEVLPWDSASTLFANTHGAEMADGMKFSSVIVLVRNPYYTLTAEYNSKVVGEMLNVSGENLGRVCIFKRLLNLKTKRNCLLPSSLEIVRVTL